MYRQPAFLSRTGLFIDIKELSFYNQLLITRQRRSICMLKQDPKKKEQDLTPDIQPSPGTSNLGRALSWEGDLTGSEDLMVEGRIQGSITLENNTLIVAPTGRIKADIRVKNINIQGQVEGQIHATGKVFISEQGRMSGEITARRISIQDGAQFKGSVKMMSAVSQ